MKKNILFLVLLLSGFSSVQAQMYVGSNSNNYVFVNNDFIYVAKEIELDNASNFYLRKDAQLLQGTVGAGANKGSGALSVFQEGTTNNFAYNYWCSPVGAVSGSSVNNPFSITQLSRPTGVTTSEPANFLGSELNGTTTNSSLNIASRWVYKYISSNIYAPDGGGWISVKNTGTVEPGYGFTMKGVSGTDATIANPVSGVFGDDVKNNKGSNQRYDFRGKPNDGTIITVVDAGKKTLIGNPYPSAINLNWFLFENNGYPIDEATGSLAGFPNIPNDPSNPDIVIALEALFWEQKQGEAEYDSHVLKDYLGGYGVYIPSGGPMSPGAYAPATWKTYNGDGTVNTTSSIVGKTYARMLTPVGQGFMIRGLAGGNVEMKNKYRVFEQEGVANNSEFGKGNSGENKKDTNWGNIPNVAGTDYTKFSKLEAPQIRIQAILNNEYTREVVVAFNPDITDTFQINAQTPDTSLPIDVYFPLKQDKQYVITTIAFDIDKKIPFAFKSDKEVSFRVGVSNVVNFDSNQKIYLHDKQTGAYYNIKDGMFDVVLPAGKHTDRYEITFKNENAILSNAELVSDSFTVYQNNEASKLTILNTLKKDISALNLYDIAGKMVINKVNLGENEQIEVSTSGLSDGIYIVKLQTKDNFEVSKKVSIFKK